MYRYTFLKSTGDIMSNKNTNNLIDKASFETMLYNNTFWVPVNTLGKTRYTNNEFKDHILKLSPKERVESIHTLYEAIQLLQIGNFIVKDDNTYIKLNGTIWEFHRDGEESFLSNSGCCASIASWLCYVLQNKYEEIGIISMSSLSGNGHVINYIKHNGELYIIDVFSMTNRFANIICSETGKKADYRKTQLPTSVLLKVNRFSSFANFFAKFMFSRSSEYLFFLHKNMYCVPISTKISKQYTYIIYPENSNIRIIPQNREISKIRLVYKKEPNIKL